MLEPGAELSIPLQLQEWNAVLDVLAGSGPWRVVHPLIMKIASQLERHRQTQAPAPPGNSALGSVPQWAGRDA